MPLTPLADLNPGRLDRFSDGSIHAVMRQLRSEAPVHYTANSDFGAYWSLTRYKDIVEVESLPKLYSSDSARGGIALADAEFAGLDAQAVEEQRLEMFIAMDPPRHSEKRRVVAPAFTPSEMLRLQSSIRERTAQALDALPRNATFNWTQDISIRLTTDMLATLFDFPWEDRDKLNVWSDAITSLEMIRERPQERQLMLFEMGMKMFQLWGERLAAAPTADLISRMIHSNAMGAMDQKEFIGNMALLIVAGNDTTRNTMSGLVDAVNRWPQEWDKVLADPALAGNATQELIRWQSPVLHMRRTVTEDHEFRGHLLREGDRVVMWYLSGNRDEDVFAHGDRFIADRENARRHIGFGYGIHRCVGARLAEMQIHTLIDELRDRKLRPELAGPIVQQPNNFVSQISDVPVRLVAA